jgi:hypothetical protein
MATFTQDPRVTLLGAGFRSDNEAQDGIHLRWSFDPALGFPTDGFRLSRRPAETPKSFHLSFAKLGGQLMQLPAPAGVDEGVTVHRADGGVLTGTIRCDKQGLALGSVPLVLRFRKTIIEPPGLVREVTLLGSVQGGGVFARALHAGRVTDCAGTGDEACLKEIAGFESQGSAPGFVRLGGSERLLPGRALRRQYRESRKKGSGWSALVKAERAVDQTAAAGKEPKPVLGECMPFSLTLRADAIDEIQISGCSAVLAAIVWSPIPEDDGDRNWELLHGPVYLPVEQWGDPLEMAKERLPEEGDLPPGAPTRDELIERLLGPDFEELTKALKQLLDNGGQLTERLPSDDPEDSTTWNYDVVRDALTAAADPYFARILGLYWVHKDEEQDQRFDYKLEANWTSEEQDDWFRWIAYDLGVEEQAPLPAPVEPTATARPGSAHITFEGAYNPCEMDVAVGWRRPSVCELADPLLAPLAYLIERTAAGAPASGPYNLLNRRAFEKGGSEEVVPAMIADASEGPERFAGGFYVDRGPGYGVFHYRVLGRDLFGRTSAPSEPAQVAVTDQVAPGPPLNLTAEYFDPLDPERAASPVLTWANRDTPTGAPRRPAVTLRWVWPVSRQVQFPDLDEFRLYYRPGSLNHLLGRITAVTPAAGGHFDVTTDLAPVGPDVPLPQTAVDLGALRSEGEECPIVTLKTVGGRLVFRVRASAAAPPLVGPCAFRIGRGTSPTATQPARAPYAAFRSFEEPAHWGGLAVDPAAPQLPLRVVAASGTVRTPLPAGLAAADLEVTRTLEPADGGAHWHFEIKLRGLALAPSLERPRVVGAFGIGAVDLTGNQGRIAPPASIFALHRVIPTVPVIVYPPVNFATPADFHGTSWFLLHWTGAAGVGYQVYRAADLDLLAAAGVDPAVHRARTPDEQRLELQQIALNPARVEAFRLVTPDPLRGTGGPMQYRDPLPGGVRNRFVYRLRAIDGAGNLAPWPPAASASCVVVDLPGVPPAAPVWADTGFTQAGLVVSAGIALRWTPNPEADLTGYRLYRADDPAAAEDVRSMTPLFTAAEAEGGGVLDGVLLTRDATGAVTGVTELPAGQRPAGRLVQFVDTTAAAGRPVYYRLVAENAAGQRSPSASRLAVQRPKSPPAPPFWGTPSITVAEVDLRWGAQEDDLECLLLRREAGALWRPLAPWTPPGGYGFTDRTVAVGTTYEYRVRVRDRVGHVVDGPLLTIDIPEN